MRLLADENFPGPAVRSLRDRGHDVLWARTDMPGAKDEEVLARATVDGRLLATMDKDFGELAVRRGLPASCGVVLFRISRSSLQRTCARIVQVLEGRRDWVGTFAVVEESRIRMRPLASRTVPGRRRPRC